MKLSEIISKTRTGFSPYPGSEGRYTLNKSASVQFIGEPPKDVDVGSWKFEDGNFSQTITGTFKDAVMKATSSHKHSSGSSFSHMLKVKKV
jgi:hypothetical protein